MTITLPSMIRMFNVRGSYAACHDYWPTGVRKKYAGSGDGQAHRSSGHPYRHDPLATGVGRAKRR
ncbi:hypothetical protein D3C85_1807670 [compost metagenome]